MSGGCAAFALGAGSRLTPVRKAATAFLQALGTGNGSAACAAMTRNEQAQIAAQYRQATCPEAVAVLLKPLSAAQRRKLAATPVGTADLRNSLGYVHCGRNPLQLTQLTLSQYDGTWLVAQLV